MTHSFAREEITSRENGIFPDPPEGWVADCLGGIGGERARRILRNAGLDVRGFHINGYAVPQNQSDRAIHILKRHGFHV